MEQESQVVDGNPKKEFYDVFIAPNSDGAFANEEEFFSVIQEPGSANDIFEAYVKPTGAYANIDEFRADFFPAGKSTPQQPPVYKPDNTKRFTIDEASSLVDKYLPGVSVTPNAREAAIKSMVGKTELELTRQFPQLGKRLAEVQKKSAAPGTTSSVSSGAQSVLPSLAEQAEREAVFGRYEQEQGYFAKVDKAKKEIVDNRNSSFTLPNNEEGKRVYLDATGIGYNNAKLNANKARNEAFDKIKPMLEKDFSDEKNLEKFIRTNESGIKTADPYFIDEYAKNLARLYNQPEDGYFKEVIYNEATKLASFKAIEPDVLKKYEERKKNILKKYEAKIQQDFDKNFTTDEIEQQKLDGQVKLLSERMKAEYKVEEDKLIQGLKGASSQFDADYLSASQILKQQAEEINRLANEGAMPPNEAQARIAALEQEQEQIYSTYVAAKDESFNTYLSQANQLSSKYNTRLKRQAEELADIAKRSVEKAKEEFLQKSGGNAEMAKELELAYKMAYSEVIKEKEAQIQGQYAAGFFRYGGDQLGLGILSQFSEAFQTSLGGSLKGLGTTIDSNWLQRYGDYLSTKYSLPQAKTEEFSDLFDVQNMTQLSGQLAGSMTTSMAATVAAGALTGGAGLAVLPRLAITGFTGWMAESADMAGRMYDDTFRQTGDAALASQRAEQMWDAQVKLMPLYAFEGLPFIGSAVKRLPFIERVVAGAGIEFTSELAQESFQNVAEKNISAGNEAFDNAINMAMDNLKETAITIAPVAFLGAAGNLNREASTQEKLDAIAKGYAQKVAASDILNKGNAATDTWVSRMVASSGGINFATTTINTLFANGTITEEQKVQMEESALQANQNIQNAKAAGLSTSNAIVYDAMAKKVNALNAELAAAKESGDVANQKLISANLKTAEQLLDTFAKTKAGDFATIEFADGSFVVMTDLSFMQEPDAAEKLKGTRVQVYSENGAQLLVDYTAKAEALIASENPLTPNTNESVQQNNQDVSEGGQADGQGNIQGQDVTQDGQEDGRQEGLLTGQTTAAQEGETSSAAGVDLDVQIKVAKEKLAEAKRKAAAMRRSPGIAPNPQEQGKRDREVIDAYIEIGKLYFKKGVRSVEDFARELGETVSDAMKQAWDAVVSEGGSFDMGGPPAIVPPTNAPNMGGRPAGEPGRVRAVYERVAKKMEERGEPQVQIDMVREKGRYQPQSRQETWDIAAALIEEMGGNYDAALMVASSIETGEFNYEIVKAILAIQQNKLWEKSKSAEGLTLDEVNQFSTRIDQIAKASTSEGRSMDLNKDIYHSNPDLFYYDQVDSKISEKNKSKMSTEDRAATRKASQKARKVRTDAFSLMSEVLAGRVSLEALYTPGNKYYLSDAKLRNLLSVLVTFGQSLDGIDPEAKNILKAIFQQTEAFGNDVPLSKIRELIAANLNDLNGRVPVPFPIEQLQQVEAAMMDLFMELLSSEWNKTFDGRSKSFGEWVYSGKIRKDAVSLLAGAIGGLFPFENILDPKSKYYVSDNKLRDIIRRAVGLGLNFSLKEAIKKVQQKELTIEEVEQLIENEIRNNNGGLSVPLGDVDLAELIKQIKWTFRSEAYDYIIKNSKEPKPFVSKRDIFNQLANVVSGKSDAAILFSFGDLTKRMQRGLAKLLSVIGTEAGPVSDVAFVPLRALLRSGQFGNMANARSNEFVPTKGRSKVQAAVEAIQRNNATQAILDFLSDPRVNGVTSGPQFKDVLDEYVAGLDEASIKAIEEGMLWLYNDFVVKNPGYKPGNKSGLSQILDRLRESGIWSMDVTRTEVENIVRAELTNLNPSLQTPMDTQEIQDVAASILDIYEEIAEKRLTELLQKEMPRRYTKALQVQLPKVVKSIMYGALELDETNPAKSDVVMNKFAPYFGGINPNLFTDQQKATLRQMAKNVVAAAKQGGMNYQIQLQSFNRTLQSIIAQNSPLSKKIPYRLELFGAYMSAFIYENILFSIGTVVRTFFGNFGRVFMKGVGAIMKGDFDIFLDAWRRVAQTQKIENVELIDGAGNNVFTDVELNRTINGAYSAVRGNPKAAEAKTKGLSNIELEIRMMDSRIARIAARLSLTLAQRTLTASDAATTPLAAHVTKAQIFYEYIKNAYESAGIPYTRYEITQQVNEILQPTQDAFSKALQQAYQETIQSELFQKAGIPFPFTKPSISEFSTMSVKAKIYNEWLMRTYAIIDSQEAQRAQQIAFNAGYLGSLDILKDVEKIDDFVAKVVSEMTFLGTPRGSFGVPAEFVNSFNAKVPVLKYTNVTPMFANAAFNAMALFVKMAPGLNAAQLVKYSILKSRGRWFWNKGEEIDVNAIKKIDKQDMISVVASTSLLSVGVLSVMSMLRGDDEDERRRIFNRKGTFITPVRLPDWLRALGYKPGTIYIDGAEVYNYRDGAFVGFFAPVAYIDAMNIGINTSATAKKPMLDNDPEFIEAVGKYTMHLMATLVDNSMLRPTVDMAYELQKAINDNPDPGEGDAAKATRVKNVLLRNLASIPKNLIPKGRLLGELKNIADAVSGEPEKTTLPSDFYNFFRTGTAFENWADVSNRTDWFGRPVPESMKVPLINSIYGFFFENDKPSDPYITLFLEKNYVPKSIPSEKMAFEVSEKTIGTDAFNDAEKKYKALVDNEADDREVAVNEGASVVSEYESGFRRLPVTMSMTAKETYFVHEKKGQFVLSVLSLGENLSRFNTLEPEVFEKAMNKLYSIGRYSAIINAAKEGMFKGALDDEGLQVLVNQFKNQLQDFKDTYGSKSDIVIDDMMLYQFDNTRLPD